MKVFAVKCKECGDTIYSRARHDFRECSCGNTFVDGGFDYIRFGGLASDPFEIEVNATKEELFNDYNKGIDKFGVIKEDKSS